jgi:hypothetical protein
MPMGFNGRQPRLRTVENSTKDVFATWGNRAPEIELAESVSVLEEVSINILRLTFFD